MITQKYNVKYTGNYIQVGTKIYMKKATDRVA